MSTRIAIIVVSLAAVGCGEIDESVNPSDVSQAGTGLAILSSAGFEDDFDSSSNDMTLNNVNSSNINSTTSNNNGTAPSEIDCTGAITVKGALDESFASPSGCGAGLVGGRATSISWVFGSLERSFTLSDLPDVPAGELSTFDATGRYATLDGDPQRSWATSCSVRLTGSTPYQDDQGRPRAIWRGTVICAEPAQAYERADALQDWAPTGGATLSINGFTFRTPYPSG